MILSKSLLLMIVVAFDNKQFTLQTAQMDFQIMIALLTLLCLLNIATPMEMNLDFLPKMDAEDGESKESGQLYASLIKCREGR